MLPGMPTVVYAVATRLLPWHCRALVLLDTTAASRPVTWRSQHTQAQLDRCNNSVTLRLSLIYLGVGEGGRRLEVVQYQGHPRQHQICKQGSGMLACPCKKLLNIGFSGRSPNHICYYMKNMLLKNDRSHMA
ncbi:hypothetical protein DL89DRAFT_369 [Linderina pennispora]|uniref:Secreted protein n=1 Tax=Linderina pennispora TaxID=61395 RepID=A0A1Y1WK03_9FUNG|nr:uncharacterized protein DL89DRAFT_369 [Linderina pennispora]ORX73546.1 hypothetical protein DL89DRAFT_369 [Linderina pennispora]